MAAPGLKIPTDSGGIDDVMLKTSLNHVTKYLASEVTFLFEKENSDWNISTLSRKSRLNFVTNMATQQILLNCPMQQKIM